MDRATIKYLVPVLLIGLCAQVYAEGESVTIKQQVKILKRQVHALKTDLNEIEFTPTGVALGEMQYWDGDIWKIINAPDMNTTEAQVLTFVNGAFSWNVVDGSGDPSETLYAIGDVGPAGGIVFYITDGGLHGLEAAWEDQGRVEWGCFEVEVSGAGGVAIGSGSQNTAAILAGCTETGIAAQLADVYSLNGFDDWFLPSTDELNELYNNRDVVGALNTYWSSSSNNSTLAWVQSFASSNRYSENKYIPLNVRAIRAF